MEEQLNREMSAFECCTLEEEFDFKGLGKCLLNKLTDENTLMGFAAIEITTRDYIKDMINKESIRDSKAETKESKERVRKITENCFSIVETFLQSSISREHSVLGRQIVDNVTEHTDEVLDKVEKNLSQKIDDLGEKISSQNSSSALPEKRK